MQKYPGQERGPGRPITERGPGVTPWERVVAKLGLPVPELAKRMGRDPSKIYLHLNSDNWRSRGWVNSRDMWTLMKIGREIGRPLDLDDFKLDEEEA